MKRNTSLRSVKPFAGSWVQPPGHTEIRTDITRGRARRGAPALPFLSDPVQPSEYGKGFSRFCWQVNVKDKRTPAGGERGSRPPHTPFLKTLRSNKEISVHLCSQNLLLGVALGRPIAEHLEWATVALKASVTVWLVSTVRTGVPSEEEHGKDGEDAGTPPDQLALTHCI